MTMTHSIEDSVVPSAMLDVEIGGASSAGCRPVNEDAFAAREPGESERNHKGIVACIADGASCSSSAQLASQTSVTNFIEDYYSTPDSWSVRESAACVLSSLNSWLFNTGRRGSQQDSLVTTFSAVILKSTTAHLFHVGDSRIYRLKNGRLEQLTTDHTRPRLGQSPFLTRALGIDSHLQVDYSRIEINKGDLLLLTSDGLHQYLDKTRISELLDCDNEDLESTSKQLISMALAQGSDDNLSCLVIRVNEIPGQAVDEIHRKLTRLTIPPAMEPGMTLDGFEVIRVLHAGTRSHVYQVKDQTDGTLYVLKAPSINFEDDPLYLESFLREQWAGRRLNHHNIMKIYPGEETSPFLYHLCEYVEGQTLRQWILDNPNPPPEKVRDFLKSIVIALRAFQRMSMVHRDIKPENIMLDANGSIKIIDFGTVQVSGLQEVSSPLAEQIPVGSVNYTAPEYIRYGKAASTSDLYSLGVIAYELLTGKLPYSQKSQAVQSLRNKDWQYLSLRRYRPDIPVWIDLAIEKALSRDPSRRQQAYSEFIQDICTPNQSLLKKHESAPLLERDPTLFWQGTSVLMFLLLLASLYF